jgi:hypothetical protein
MAAVKDRVDYCYFRCVSVTGYAEKYKHKTVYAKLNSAMRLISHDDNLPVPEPPENRLAF